MSKIGQCDKRLQQILHLRKSSTNYIKCLISTSTKWSAGKLSWIWAVTLAVCALFSVISQECWMARWKEPEFGLLRMESAIYFGDLNSIVCVDESYRLWFVRRWTSKNAHRRMTESSFHLQSEWEKILCLVKLDSTPLHVSKCNSWTDIKWNLHLQELSPTNTVIFQPLLKDLKCINIIHVCAQGQRHGSTLHTVKAGRQKWKTTEEMGLNLLNEFLLKFQANKCVLKSALSYEEICLHILGSAHFVGAWFVFPLQWFNFLS